MGELEPEYPTQAPGRIYISTRPREAPRAGTYTRAEPQEDRYYSSLLEIMSIQKEFNGKWKIPRGKA
jgi:hypothetical protein